MRIHATAIDGVSVVETDIRSDARGAFARIFCQEELQGILGARSIVQMNHSCTNKVGAVRGMHYQMQPHAEMKLVRCIKGKVWDVAVDLRRDSPTFLKWHAQELSPDNMHMMVIPEGCAHGFQVLEPQSELIYLHTAAYAPSAEGGVQPSDSMLSINWPLPISELSERDSQHPNLNTRFTGLKV